MSLESYGAIMKISEHIRGLCPTMHLADITLKNPSKKFTSGKNVTCRVSAFIMWLCTCIIKNSTRSPL